MRTLIRVCFMALAILLAAMPLLACGGGEAPTPTPAPTPAPSPPPAPAPSPPGGNQPPVITSLTAEPEKVDLGGTATITCVATDADGDTLYYAWSVDSGTISSRALNVLTWKAPETDGDSIISVEINDGKGGNVAKQLMITVGAPQRAKVLDPVPDESGSVYSTGDLVSSWLVGDSADNNGVRAFFSFDLSGLTGAEIKEAKLTFHTKETVGNPWTIHAFLYVEQVDYGSRPLQGGDFDLEGFELAKSASSVPEAVDVALPINRLLQAPVKTRLQVRLRLGQPTENNSKDDYVSFSGACINITYIK